MYSSRNRARSRAVDGARGAARHQVAGLREEPRVAQDAAADEHAGHGRRAKAIQDLLRLDESPQPKTGILTASATRAMRSQSAWPR